MTYLAILKLVLQLLPLLLDAIKTVEAASNISGNGAAKLDLVKGILTNTIDIGNDVDKAQYNTAVEKTISLAVSFFNTIGLFKKGA